MGSSEQQRAVVCFTTPFLSSYGGIILGMFFSNTCGMLEFYVEIL